VLEGILNLKFRQKITVDLVHLSEEVECYCDVPKARRVALMNMLDLDDIRIKPHPEVLHDGVMIWDGCMLHPVS
jgi:hypothetical protein